VGVWRDGRMGEVRSVKCRAPDCPLPRPPAAACWQGGRCCDCWTHTPRPRHRSACTACSPLTSAGAALPGVADVAAVDFLDDLTGVLAAFLRVLGAADPGTPPATDRAAGGRLASHLEGAGAALLADTQVLVTTSRTPAPPASPARALARVVGPAEASITGLLLAVGLCVCRRQAGAAGFTQAVVPRIVRVVMVRLL
jgi:hypothetical protein